MSRHAHANSEGLRVLIATVAGLVLRLAWWWYARPEPVSDFEYYRRSAMALLEHHQFGFPLPSGRAPAYPAFLAGAMLFGRSIAWLSLVNILLSTALVPLTARLTRLLTGRDAVAAGAAWVVALNPTFIFFAPVLASEHLFGPLFVAAFIAALSAPRGTRSLTGAIGAGALLGAAALTRADALFYAPLLAALIWWRSGRRRLVPAAMVLAMAVVLAPWFVRNRIVMGPGSGISTAGGLTFYYAHNERTYGYHPLNGTPLEGLSETALQTRGYDLGVEHLSRAGWSKILGDIFTATTRQLIPSYPFGLVWATQSMGRTPDDMSTRPLAGYNALSRLSEIAYYMLMLGAGLSLFFVRRYPRTAWFVLFGVVGLNWFAHCVVFLGEGRYRYPAELMCCVLFAMCCFVGRTFRSAE